MAALVLQTLTLGVLQGGIYVLMAIGLSLIFGVLRVVNFAHGEFAMIGALAAWFATASLGFPLPLGIVAAAVAGGLAGYLTNRLILAPIYERKMENRDEFVVITTFMLSQFLIAAATVGFGGNYRRVPGLWDENLNIFETVHLSGNRVAAFLAAIVLVGLLFVVVFKTDLGRAWRALAQNALGAAVVGIDVRRYADYAFAASGALVGVGATLMAPLGVIYPGLGVVAVAKAFVVVIIGGLGSIGGTVVAGLLLGLVEALGSVFVSSSYTEAYGSVLMILVLLLRPTGLFGATARQV